MKKVYLIVKIVFNHPAQEESVRYLREDKKRQTWVSDCSLATQFEHIELVEAVVEGLTVWNIKEHFRIDTHYVKA